MSAASLLLAEGGGGREAVAEQGSRPVKGSKLAGPLEELAAHARSQAARGRAFEFEALPATLKAMVKHRLLRLDEQGRAMVEVSFAGDAGAAAGAVESAGGDVEMLDLRAKKAHVEAPAERLGELAALPEVKSVGLPDYPRVAAGSVTSQGDGVHNVDDVRNLYGLSGAGVRIGVISDGVAGLQESQFTGDSPAVNTTSCNMVPPNASLKYIPELGMYESRDPTWYYAGAEGTAMIEIIHDLAPNAEIWFGYFGLYLTNYGTTAHVTQAIDCLSQQVDIVVDDLYSVNEGPYDGTSPISVNSSNALNHPARPIRGFYKAAGNSALDHYEGPYVDSGTNIAAFELPGTPPGDFWDVHRYSMTPGTSDAGIGLACGCVDTVRLASGGFFVAQISWDDPWGASANDYDFFLRNRGSGEFVAGGGLEQNGDDDPAEFLLYFNDSSFTQTLDIYLGNYNGLAAARTFEQFTFCFGCEPLAGGVFHNYNTPGSSIPNNSDAGGGVVSLGAVPWSGPGGIEPYSSRGPRNDGLQKPEAVAVDAVSVSGAGDFPTTFQGTSAASPHAAGIAALLLECNRALRSGDEGDDPATERDALRSLLLDHAVELGAVGPDVVYGYGRLDALSSAVALDCGDPDGDGVRNGYEAWVGSDPQVADTDADGCTDGQELGPMANRGGRRSPTNGFDFFDVPTPAGAPGTGTRDRIVSTGDLVAVVAKFGSVQGGPAVGNGQLYDPPYDRTYQGPDPWDVGAGDGRVTVQDISLIVAQFGHSCA